MSVNAFADSLTQAFCVAMPWPTTDGLRNLAGAEADLVRGAIGMMVDTHVSELRGESEPWNYGVDWFDQWDAGQRLWLLEKVASAFFGSSVIEPVAAIFDATADAVFHDVGDLIRMEIDPGIQPLSERCWRQSVVDAFVAQNNRPPSLEVESADVEAWHSIITRIADSVLGIRLYQRAERFRDFDYVRTQRFLRDRGLPGDYLSRIPPLRSTDQTQDSIDRIQAFVFD